MLFGNVQLTAPALLTLLKEGIDTVFLRADGRYVGRLSWPEPDNVSLRKRQFALCDDMNFRVRTARAIVRAKIRNQAAILSRISRARRKIFALSASLMLKECARGLDKARSCDELRGMEGKAAAIYFKHLSLGLLEDWGFSRRVRRPPTDPVNCVLSFLYTMLAIRCHTAVRLAGLDPQPGILHEICYGRNCLPLDLMEEFRAPLADALTLSLFNMKQLSRDDFLHPPEEPEPAAVKTPDKSSDMDGLLSDPLGIMDARADPDQEEPAEELEPKAEAGSRRRLALLLSDDARKTVLTAFARKMDTRFQHPVAGRSMTFFEALIHQARELRRVIEGKMDEYTPLTLR